VIEALGAKPSDWFGSRIQELVKDGFSIIKTPGSFDLPASHVWNFTVGSGGDEEGYSPVSVSLFVRRLILRAKINFEPKQIRHVPKPFQGRILSAPYIVR